MKYLKNNQGYALVLVLFAIVLISVLGMGLMGSTLSTAKQTEKADTIYRATHIAEMGATYAKHSIQDYTKEHEIGDLTLEEYTNLIFDSIPDEVQVDPEHPNRKFLIKPKTDNVTTDDNTMKVQFDIIGQDGDHRNTKTLTTTMEIRGLIPDDSSDGLEGLFPDLGDFDWEEVNELDKNKEYNSHLWVSQETTIKNEKITVNGHCVANKEIYSSNGSGSNSGITICGNAKFVEGISGDESGSNGFKGKVVVGNHALFQDKLYMHQGGGGRDFISGGTTELQNGADIGNMSFTVGQDLIIHAGNNRKYSFSKEADVQGDLIIKNVEPNEDLSDLIDGKINVGGDVKIQLKNQDTPTEQNLSAFNLDIADFQYDDFGSSDFDVTSYCDVIYHEGPATETKEINITIVNVEY
ncbi:hypothetical protein [Salinibacillus xinjiangensis]|uniref:Type 4 fimbrial biogenesis protein PilX N-terminal domain-containing protein n=1 Tax=Salinibacillus xinjiangensis TaxID=1229268 RepID=A0A6G1X9M6_9BACI|nr:hypothetical protein [Salinibacillus xinjiangensis]MRG87488.1 hypothetical protein [Salinibacillus xinjiangensis]